MAPYELMSGAFLVVDILLPEWAEHPATRRVLAARVGFTASVWSSAVPPDLKGVGIDGTLSRFRSLDSFAESQ